MTTDKPIPDDFPRSTPLSAVAGVQPKLAVRKVSDRYITGLTEEELQRRYAYCDDLAQQLMAYCRRKALEHPEWTHEANLDRMARGVAQKAEAWDLSVEEQRWIEGQVKALLGW